MRCLFALALLATLPAAARADDVTALYPDSATFAFGVNVKGIAASPLGKTVIGDDKPFDAARKLIKVLIPADVFVFTEQSLKPLETVANKLDRVAVAGALFDGNPPPIVILLEGTIDEGEYSQAAAGYAKAANKPFATEKRGDRTLLILGGENERTYGLRVHESLFVIATDRELIDEVLDKHAGTRKAKMQPALAGWLKKAKPAATPLWLTVGEIKNGDGLLGGVATITLNDDAEFRIEVGLDKVENAATIKTALEWLVAYIENEKSPQAKVWRAAAITVKQDGTTVRAAGRFPGQLLIEEYAKQK